MLGQEVILTHTGYCKHHQLRAGARLNAELPCVETAICHTRALRGSTNSSGNFEKQVVKDCPLLATSPQAQVSLKYLTESLGLAPLKFIN
jgi:hypothetical protein